MIVDNNMDSRLVTSNPQDDRSLRSRRVLDIVYIRVQREYGYPSQGLLLERPVFSGMSEKRQKFGQEALNWEPYSENIENFKEEFIYRSIFRETTAEIMYFRGAE
jgi:hypothetical protein